MNGRSNRVIDDQHKLTKANEGPSLESIQSRANNILSRLESIEYSILYLANGPQPGADKKDKSAEPSETNIPSIEDVLIKAQDYLLSIENNLSKLRYG